MRMLLTSTGFDNVNIKNKFLSLLNKDVSDVKVLFIITAANDCESVRVLSFCLDDLSGCGISDANITVYDMHKLIDVNDYDVIYVCGGSTNYLTQRFNELNFNEVLDGYDGIYVGVSAGSKVLSRIGFISNKLDVHCDVGSADGKVCDDDVFITDNQAMYVCDDCKVIFS